MKYIRAAFLSVCIMTTSAIAQKQPGKAISGIVSEIAKNNKYESRFVGFAGTPSQQYSHYQDLRKTATKEELVELLNHKNAVVRIYGFKALYETDRETAEKYSAELLKDTADFMTLQGCIAGTETVKNYVRRMLRNAD